MHAPYVIQLRTSSASQKDFGLLSSALNASITALDSVAYPDRQSVATISQTMIRQEGGRTSTWSSWCALYLVF